MKCICLIALLIKPKHRKGYAGVLEHSKNIMVVCKVPPTPSAYFIANYRSMYSKFMLSLSLGKVLEL